MREIKFRAWYKDKFHYNIEKHHVEHHSMSGFSGDVWDFSDWLKYAKVQQYTGLKDQRDKEIWEGDIVNTIYNNRAKVVYDEKLVAFRLLEGKTSIPVTTYRFSDGKPVGMITVVGEVIGNIFENPELLGKNE